MWRQAGGREVRQERKDERGLRRAFKAVLRHSHLLSRQQEAVKGGQQMLRGPSTGRQEGRQADTSSYCWETWEFT